jgi:hypothetical protein
MMFLEFVTPSRQSNVQPHAKVFLKSRARIVSRDSVNYTGVNNVASIFLLSLSVRRISSLCPICTEGCTGHLNENLLSDSFNPPQTVVSRHSMTFLLIETRINTM